MAHTNKSLRELIWERRTELGLTQKDISKAIGLSPDSTYIGMVENGTRRFNLEMLRDLAKVLRLPLDELIELHFRERYNTEETVWLIELLFSAPKRFARSIASLDPESREALKVMLDILIDKQAKRSTGKSSRLNEKINEKISSREANEHTKEIGKKTVS